MRAFAAHRAHIGIDGPGWRAAAFKNIVIRLQHGRIIFIQRFFAGIQRVGILHDEFAQTHQSTARARLIAELFADVVNHARQITVAFDLAQGQIYHNFFMGG